MAGAESEQWLPVVRYGGLYEVSHHGRVRSLDRFTVDTLGRRRFYPGRVLSPCLNGSHTGSYPSLNLSRQGRNRTVRIHLLVLEAFVGPRPDGKDVTRHLNGNPTDNHLSNLAYGTSSENMQDRLDHGVHHYAKRTHCKNGHEFTPENTRLDTSTCNKRVCRACRRKSYKRVAA